MMNEEATILDSVYKRFRSGEKSLFVSVYPASLGPIFLPGISLFSFRCSFLT